jgi:hypothetical protein
MKKEKFNSINTLLVIFAICFFGCSSSNNDNEPLQEEEVTLEGNYIGTWNSTTPTATFTNVSVSAKLRFSGSNTNKLTGGFFISSDFTVCCSSGDNDGTLTIDFDGNTITSFRYSDVITNCSGTFVGEGVIREFDGALVIDFTGNDCDGDHVGQLILRK